MYHDDEFTLPPLTIDSRKEKKLFPFQQFSICHGSWINHKSVCEVCLRAKMEYQYSNPEVKVRREEAEKARGRPNRTRQEMGIHISSISITEKGSASPQARPRKSPPASLTHYLMARLYFVH